MTHVRAVTVGDLPLMAEWMREAPEAPAWNVDDLSAVTRVSPDTLQRRGWIAEDDAAGTAGFAVASALLLPNHATECELEFVLVRPEARRCGVGARLLRAVMEWARELGAVEVRLEVRVSNEAARRLYAACGFVETARRRGYYAHPAEDAVLMRLAVNG